MLSLRQRRLALVRPARRHFLILSICLAAVACLPAPALAASAPRGRALGVIATHGPQLKIGNSIRYAASKSGGGNAGGTKSGGKKGGGGTSGGSTPTVTIDPLTYHGGAVFSSPAKVYDIYWVPSGSSVATGYQSTVDGFVQNLAAAGGPTTNAFFAATQYTDGSGAHVASGASYGGSATVADPFPASGCTDSALPKAACMSDLQVANEIRAVAQANGWSVAYPNVFVMLMPKGVGNCATTSTGAAEGYCSIANACAWHHQWGGLYFVVQPYVGNQTGCQSGQAPTGSYDGSQAVNTMSHELNETLTDPAGGSWYDSSGDENGDKCSWNFGPALGGSSGSLYNQVINGTHYYLQQEWSNASAGCVQQGT